MAFTLTITNAGRAALVNASNTGTAPVTIAQCGISGTAVVPSPTATTLPAETKRIATLSGDVIAADTIHLIVRDESADVFTVRSLALYLGDGTLFAIYGQAAPILEKSALAQMLLAIDLRFADIDADLLTFGDANFLNPPATTERLGIVELATPAEAIAGTDAARVPPVAAIQAAVNAWLNQRFGAGNSGIWHPGNDGAGSGLDADTLDGQQGVYYLPASNYTAADLLAKLRTVDGAGSGIDADTLDGQQGSYYLPGGSYTPSDILAKLLTVDGAGSGLDADTLDGQQGSYYTNIVDRLGYVPVQMGTGIGQGPNAVKLGWKIGSRLGLTVDSVDLGNFVLDGHIADVWRASNDGAGSGLDADLLDGRQGSDYIRADGSNAFTASAKFSDPNGLLLKPAGFNPTLIMRNDGARFYLMVSGASASHNGIWNALRPLAFDLATGALTSENGQYFYGGAYFVGICRVDGRDVATVTQQSIGNDGYMIFSNGLKIVWGRMNVVQDSYHTVNYPIAFVTNPSVTFATIDAVNSISQQNSLLVDQTPTWFRMYQSGDRNASLPYIAIGW